MRVSAVLALAIAALAAFALPAAFARDDYTPEALADEITYLPGAPDNVPFRMFSGYIPVHDGSRQIFYWFFEAYENAEEAPLMWWTSGGPGCAGTGVGGLGENGPFEVTRNITVSLRKWSWNKFASVVYVDQPAGVGYSILDKKGTPYGDALSAKENYEFLKNFLERFPNFKSNPLYLSSESYGGHYVPTLAQYIAHNDNNVINFHGFVVGNPLTYMPYRDYGQVHSMGTHQFAPDRLWQEYSALCTPDPKAPTTNPPPARHRDCDGLESKILRYQSGTDPYAMDFPICTGDAMSRKERFGSSKPIVDRKTHFLRAIKRAQSLYKTSILHDYFPENYEPCVDSLDTQYMNLPQVRKALHVSPKADEWSICSNINYSDYDMITSMIPVYHDLIKVYNGKLKMLIFAGDNDSICAASGEQIWIWEQGWEITKEWAAWKVNKQVAGFHVAFRGIDFMTIHGAGHMCPATRPEQTSTAIRCFVTGGCK